MIIQREGDAIRVCAESTDRKTAMKGFFMSNPPDTNHPKYKMVTAYIDGVEVDFHYTDENICSGYRFIWKNEWKYATVNINVFPILDGERLTIVTY